ncbi:CBF/Mak21 family protein [Cardiosporidium cionae]|uniref:CBF/Mak21 family protein n=1 Tax=Cardiosporidium cionae TaxID=476202 RepID=A0ABQ7J7E5_9APIC|nr:CBF/Mak21 family protein [Cardiosporidium cionae]|eukprot:KAF8819625.1 CBF/Mak21 family protein [Cardiosporidium cionae]
MAPTVTPFPSKVSLSKKGKANPKARNSFKFGRRSDKTTESFREKPNASEGKQILASKSSQKDASTMDISCESSEAILSVSSPLLTMRWEKALLQIEVSVNRFLRELPTGNTLKGLKKISSTLSHVECLSSIGATLLEQLSAQYHRRPDLVITNDSTSKDRRWLLSLTGLSYPNKSPNTPLASGESASFHKANNARTPSSFGSSKNKSEIGTLSDRIAALGLLIQQSAIFNVPALRMLLQMAGKQNRKEALLAIEALRDLFTEDLLPHRKLIAYEQPLPVIADASNSSIKKPKLQQVQTASLTTGDKSQTLRESRKSLKQRILPHIPIQWIKGDITPENWKLANPNILFLLVLWYFEDSLKMAFAAFIQILSNALFDSVEFFKLRSLQFIFELLISKPEQEQALLRCLVNKLGDPCAKISSKASSLLVKVIENHPPMKKIVSEYVCTSILEILAQIPKAGKDKQSLQNKSLHRKKSKNRFIPRAVEAMQNIITHLLPAGPPLLFLSELRFRQSDAPLAASIMQLYLYILDIVFDESFHKFPENGRRHASRQYVYEQPQINRIVRIVLNGLNRSYPFAIEFIRNSEKWMTGTARVTVGNSAGKPTLPSSSLPCVGNTPPFAHHQNLQLKLDALYKAVHLLPIFSTKIVLLNVLFKILLSYKLPLARFYRIMYDKLLYMDIYKTRNMTSLLLLLYGAIKEDGGSSCSLSLIKRLLQTTLHLDPAAVSIASLKLCDALYSEQLLDTTVLHLSESQLLETDEHFVDYADSSDEEKKKVPIEQRVDSNTMPTEAFSRYDPYKREPKYSKANESHFWETLFCTVSYHPTIATTAIKLRQYADDCFGKKEKEDSKAVTSESFEKKSIEKNGIPTPSSTTMASENTRMTALAASISDCLHTYTPAAFLDAVSTTGVSPRIGGDEATGESPLLDGMEDKNSRRGGEKKVSGGSLEENEGEGVSVLSDKRNTGENDSDWNRNSASFWTKRATGDIKPHEKWMALYYKDPFVMTQERERRGKSKKKSTFEKSDGNEKNGCLSDVDGLQDSEDEIDTFADDLFEKELKPKNEESDDEMDSFDDMEEEVDDDAIENDTDLSGEEFEENEMMGRKAKSTKKGLKNCMSDSDITSRGKRSRSDSGQFITQDRKEVKEQKKNSSSTNLRKLKQKVKSGIIGSFADAKDFEEYINDD